MSLTSVRVSSFLCYFDASIFTPRAILASILLLINVKASLKNQIGIFEITCSSNMFEKPFVCICLYLESIYFIVISLDFAAGDGMY